MNRHLDLPHQAALDRTDLAILDVLRRQGRISNEKLSALVHLTPRPCSERVRKLERQGSNTRELEKGHHRSLDWCP
jgi:DNA-binding Lrp family transcriptional regulator